MPGAFHLYRLHVIQVGCEGLARSKLERMTFSSMVGLGSQNVTKVAVDSVSVCAISAHVERRLTRAEDHILCLQTTHTLRGWNLNVAALVDSIVTRVGWVWRLRFSHDRDLGKGETVLLLLSVKVGNCMLTLSRLQHGVSSAGSLLAPHLGAKCLITVGIKECLSGRVQRFWKRLHFFKWTNLGIECLVKLLLGGSADARTLRIYAIKDLARRGISGLIR